MAISHSNHLFVPVAFVFCLLSPLIHTSDSQDYIDSRQFEKNPVSEHRSNIQRLPNYNRKPPDKYYGPRNESTEKNLGMEFTKPVDLEQRMADPWIKKMQEISRQEREKWAAYRRNVKLTLDNIEETTKVGKLTNDESITIDSTSKSLVRHPSADQDSMDMKDDSSSKQFHNSFWSNSKQSADTNVDGASNKNDERNTDIKNSSKKLLQKVSVTVAHQRHKDYEISDVKEEPFFKQNATIDYEKGKLEDDRPITNSHPEKSISQQFKDAHIYKSSMGMQKNFMKFSENDRNSSHINDSKEFPVKKYSKQFNFSRDNKKESSNDNKGVKQKMVNLLMQKKKKNDNLNSHTEKSISQPSKTLHVLQSATNKNHKKFSEAKENLNYKTDSKLPVKEYSRQSSPSQKDNEKNNEDNKKDDEKTITARSLMWKSKKEKDGTGRKDVIEKLNHERSFQSSRWGMSASSPPTKFLKDMSRQSKHRENEEQTKKDGKHRSFDRWGMSAASPPREFFEDISMHQGHGTKSATVKTGSRPNEIKGSSVDRPPIHQSRNLQTALAQRLMTNKRHKKRRGTLLGKVPNGHDYRYPNFNYWNNDPPNTDLINGLFLGFFQALQSYILEDDIDIPTSSCRMRISYASSHI